MNKSVLIKLKSWVYRVNNVCQVTFFNKISFMDPETFTGDLLDPDLGDKNRKQVLKT